MLLKEQGFPFSDFSCKLFAIELVYMDSRRNINEEFILRSMAGSSTKVPMPSMEMTSFKNHFQTFRTDSEELFKSWITSDESHSFNSPSLINRTPQAMGRMGREHNYVTPVDEENSTYIDQNSFKNVVERGVPTSNLHLDKDWFHSSRPMTRSRSSELKRNLATCQNFQTTTVMETIPDVSSSNINIPKQEFGNPNIYSEASFGNILNHMGTYVSPQLSSMSNFNEKGAIGDGSLDAYGVQGDLGDMSFDQNGQRTYHDYHRVLHNVDGPMTMSNGVQNMVTTCESSREVNAIHKENGIDRAVDYITITDDQKPKVRLVRYGSLTSSDPVDEGEVTKKRRVERSRKMAEAKERILTPNVPSDMQSIVKRCESLEKEVRSLKLNLAFMNRKDSEQIKQLEELQIQQEELTEEKERLLEEIERILTSRRNM